MKRTLTMTIAAFAITGLTACGSDSTATKTSDTASSSSTSTTPPPASSSATSSSTSTSSSATAPSTTTAADSSSGAASGGNVDDAGLVAIMKKAGCTVAAAKPAGKNGKAAGMVSGVECSGDGKSEFIGFRTTSADQVAGAMKAMTANSAKATTVYYVKGTNWAVMKSDDGQNMPTKSGTEAMQKKIGSGTVETVS